MHGKAGWPKGAARLSSRSTRARRGRLWRSPARHTPGVRHSRSPLWGEEIGCGAPRPGVRRAFATADHCCLRRRPRRAQPGVAIAPVRSEADPRIRLQWANAARGRRRVPAAESHRTVGAARTPSAVGLARQPYAGRPPQPITAARGPYRRRRGGRPSTRVPAHWAIAARDRRRVAAADPHSRRRPRTGRVRGLRDGRATRAGAPPCRWAHRSGRPAGPADRTRRAARGCRGTCRP